MSKHIEHIEITNFKSIRHQKIEGCKRINIFIGYPNVGKSNILEALSLFSLPYLKLSDSNNLTDFIRVKNLSELFYSADASIPIQIKVQQTNAIMQFSGEMNLNSSYPFRCEYTYNGKSFLDTKSIPTLTFSEALKGRWLKLPPEEFIKTEIKKYTFYKEGNNNNNQFTSFLLPPNGTNLFHIITKYDNLGKALEKEINRVDGTYFFDASENTIRILKENNGTKYSLPFSSMADTFQRLFFYTAAIVSNNNSVLLFEEPEAHMFPPYISKMVWDIMKDKDSGNQYFIATHSPFVINDLLEDERNDLSVYAVGYKNGETTIKRITEEELQEIYQYGIDLFFNLEDYLEHV